MRLVLLIVALAAMGSAGAQEKLAWGYRLCAGLR